MNNSLLGNLFPQKGVKNYLSNVLEVGFSQYGPTLSASGTLTALSKVVFVYNISLYLLNKRDRSEYYFNWFAFRPHKFSAGGYKDIELIMPSKFMVAESKTYEYNILFVDQELYSRINPLLKQIRENWRFALEQNVLSATPQNYQALFKTFLQGKFVAEAVEDLKRASYWKAGEYILKMLISTKNSSQSFETTRSFSLSDQEIKGFEQNVFMILNDLCKQPNVFYHYAYPRLSE